MTQIFLFIEIFLSSNNIAIENYIFLFLGNLVALTAGIGLAWTSPVNPKLTNGTNNNDSSDNPFERFLSLEELSWIGSLLALGSLFGPVLAGYGADKIGRKNTLLYVSGVPFVVSFLLLASTHQVWMWYLARFICGVAVGKQ